mmetsp:Transcript_39812/g.128878  ORF Transcript_39812/g.128878 Transcript_39812/m.128878 type:complete len:284 (+) Transcript_39812:243-1094(+)
MPAESFFQLTATALFGGPEHLPSVSERSPAADASYPHTHLPEPLVEALLAMVQEEGELLVVELGSFVGGSAVRIARALKRLGRSHHNAALVCVDPFCGDASMWSDHNGWRSWLRLCDGRPRLFEQFVANVHSEGHGDIVLPLSATACVGCSILCRLAAAGPGGCSGPALPRPRLVYLDAAHEEGETLLEVRRAFELLAPGGVLLGDDWDWPAVRQDVLTFAGGLRPPLPPPTFSAALGLEPVSGGCGVAVAHGGSSGGGGSDADGDGDDCGGDDDCGGGGGFF